AGRSGDDPVHGDRGIYETGGIGEERSARSAGSRRAEYSRFGLRSGNLRRCSRRRLGMNKVYLVGAGPGDPELITLKAKRLLNAADVVLHDHLANPQFLAFAPASAELIYVGKKKSDHAVSQEEICGLLIEHWRRGQNVVRLKGGDP